MITVSIDISLLDESRLKSVTRKNGEKAMFCELVLIETPNGKYGDFIVKQGITKEERAEGVKMPILGNGKSWARRRASESIPDTGSPKQANDKDEDVPF